MESEQDKSQKSNVAEDINENSIRPIYIEMYFGGTILASGTAFFVNSAKGPIFITNRHNVTGRHQDTHEPLNQNGGIPDNIRLLIL